MKPNSSTARTSARSIAQASNSSICISCQRLSRRHYASTAAATAAVPAESSPASSKSSPPSAKATSNATPRPIYQMHAGVVLSRPPMLTRELHPFESAYFFYQRRLNERLALPFTRYFYFKKGTPADLEWKRKQKERITAARDIGIYNAYGKEGWNDELMVGDKESDPQHQLEALLKDAEEPAVGEGEEVVDEEKSASKRKEVERPMDRVTEADKQCDLRSLNRMLARTLYLVVKGEDGKWRLPSARLEGKEGLARGAERVLVQSAGVNMNTWVVGHVPVGHYASNFKEPVSGKNKGTIEVGEKVFFMKGRIMGGQANLQNNALGLTEFQWLAKEEIAKVAPSRYYSMVEDMLTER